MFTKFSKASSAQQVLVFLFFLYCVNNREQIQNFELILDGSVANKHNRPGSKHFLIKEKLK